MTTFLSGDPTMYKAYMEGKDLYAMIAQSAYHNDYSDNLEFYIPGKIVDVDGKNVVSGSGKEFEISTDENDYITVKYYEILETISGDKQALDINIGDKIISDIGNLVIVDKIKNSNNITFKLTL